MNEERLVIAVKRYFNCCDDMAKTLIRSAKLNGEKDLLEGIVLQGELKKDE